jgi:hypothetical protein
MVFKEFYVFLQGMRAFYESPDCGEWNVYYFIRKVLVDYFLERCVGNIFRKALLNVFIFLEKLIQLLHSLDYLFELVLPIVEFLVWLGDRVGLGFTAEHVHLFYRKFMGDCS